MYCRPGGTSCSSPGRLGSVVLYVWGDKKDAGYPRFWIVIDAWRVSWCLRYLYIAAILWNTIQAIPGSLCDDWLFIKLDTFTSPERDVFLGFHAHPLFYSHAWLIIGNTLRMIVIWCHNHHTGPWQTWKCSATSVKHHDSPRVGHVHPQSRLIQLPMTPNLHSDKFVDLIYLFVL